MNDPIHWSTPPECPELGAGQVHVWLANLDLTPDRLAELRKVLVPEEIARANRYAFESHRFRFEAGRGILRRLLSKYRNHPAAEIQIRTNAFGKPFVEGDICFNLSHSDFLGVFVFARSTGVGIDLERVRTDIEYLEIAKSYFTEAEFKKLESTPRERQVEAFFRCWTKKEAYVKALGEGLASSTSVNPLERDPLQWDMGAPGTSQELQWNVIPFIPKDDFVGSIVSSARNLEFEWWEFSF